MPDEPEINKETQIEIGYLSAGYGWEILYYDRERDLFFVDEYHCGSVDIAATYYDGRKEFSKEEIVQELIGRNKADILEKLRHEGLL